MNDKVKLLEIKVGEKQILVFERRLREVDAIRISIGIKDWLESDDPILLIHGHNIELIKVEK